NFVTQTAAEAANAHGTPPPTYATGAAPTGLILADVNGDGKLDAITTNFTDGTVSVLLGRGDGTFGTAKTFKVGNDPTAVIAGDFDGDGKLDLVVANSLDGTLSYLQGRGNGTFVAQV